MATAALPHDPSVLVAAPPAGRRRLDSVDVLRGIVMVVMALDHVRDYFSNQHFDPGDLDRTTGALFFTRWVTHFCAPVFVFLAGTGAFLSASRGRTTSSLSRLLLTRGLWLVALEMTVVRFAWTFNLDYSFWVLQVIWAIGASMMVLAALVWLPIEAVGAIGVAMILLHNLADGMHASVAPGAPLLQAHASTRDWIISALHDPHLPVLYPLVPWIGVMAAGYAFGTVLLLPQAQRRGTLVRLGLVLTAGFVMLRAANVYGDPVRWAAQRSGTFTLLSFLNVTKYPPSLLYLLMTLGPAIAGLAWLERATGPIGRFFVVYGRVPFLYYVAHLFLVHLLALAAGVATGYPLSAMLTAWPFFPPGYGLSLGAVYLIWMAVVLALYPLCRWFAGVKARRRDWWLSYL